MKSFYTFENRVHVTGTLRAKTALAVGSRASLMPAGSDLPVIKTPEGIPFIPGSSLKGVLRAYVERIARTLDQLHKTVNGQRIFACDPLDEQHRCVNRHRKEDLVQAAQGDDRKFTEQLWLKSCTVCRLFGSQWLASRVAFQDALLRNVENLVRLTEVRDSVGIDRDLGTARTGVKFDFETVPPGAEFELNVMLENVEDWEVGLLVAALDALGQGRLGLGGKTTRGLGWMELMDLQVTRVQAQEILAYLAGQPAPRSSVDQFRKALLQSLS